MIAFLTGCLTLIAVRCCLTLNIRHIRIRQKVHTLEGNIEGLGCVGTISVYVGYRDVPTLFTTPICTYMVRTYILPLINTPTHRGGDNQPTYFSVSGGSFRLDHDFEGPRAPKSHLDIVLRNLSSDLGTSRT